MSGEILDLEEAARLLQRDPREVAKLASRGYLPARKVAGQWRFSRTELTHWVEKQMHAYTEEELAGLEGGGHAERRELLLAAYLPLECVAVPLNARTAASALRELVESAQRSGYVYDPEALLAALEQRERMASTALECGVALPHPHRPLPHALGEHVIACGRTLSGIPFGAPRGILTDVFFLVCCQDDRTHLRVLARLSRLLLQPGLLEALRQVDTPQETHELLLRAERELVLE